MNSQLAHFVLVSALSVAALASVIPFAGDAKAASTGDLGLWQSNYGEGGSAASAGDVDGRDFLIWQRGGSPATVQFNPKELTVDQSVPWK